VDTSSLLAIVVPLITRQNNNVTRTKQKKTRLSIDKFVGIECR